MMRCSPNHLEWLMTRDESSIEYQQAATHVEQCSVCQSKLARKSSVDMPWWKDARQAWLAEPLPDTSESLRTSSIDFELTSGIDDEFGLESISLDFLQEAKHPELLGRLGRYDIERVIGHGGMGIVLKAMDSELNRVVAIKILAPHLATISSARRRFAREAQAAAAVVHPHVIPIHNVESDIPYPYLVMRYVPGQSLQARVDSRGPLPIADALRIAQQTAAGLAAAHHQGLIHRDVKPANILLEDQVDRVVLSDFGLARAVDDASLTRTGIVAGTPYYMSPEQAHGHAIDFRSDLFSLGSVLYFMLAGHSPFRAHGAMAVLHRICHSPHRSLLEVNPDVPFQVSAIVDRLLAKDPQQRFASASSVERELTKLLLRLQQAGLSLKEQRTRVQDWPSMLVRKWKSWRYSKSSMVMAWGLLLIATAFAAGRSFWPSTYPSSQNRSTLRSDPDRELESLRDTSITINQFRELKAMANNESIADQQFAISLEHAKAMLFEIERSNAVPYVNIDLEFKHQVQALQQQIQQFEQAIHVTASPSGQTLYQGK